MSQLIGFFILYILGIVALYSLCWIDMDMPKILSLFLAILWPIGLPIIGALIILVNLT